MGKPRAEVVRFAVGGPDEPRSLVWRVWTTKGKSDLYISGRLQGGDWKVSLHESGDWRFALTREFAKARGMDERLIFEQWERPQSLRDGVTSAFEIVVPSAELALPRQPLPEDRKKHTKKVTWFPPAPERCATHFIVMYTEPGWPTPEAAPDFLSIFMLPDGRTVSIMVLEQAIPVVFTGTYSVKANCTGTVTYGPTEVLDVFVAPDGSMFTFVQVKPSQQVTSGIELRGTAKRVGP